MLYNYKRRIRIFSKTGTVYFLLWLARIWSKIWHRQLYKTRPLPKYSVYPKVPKMHFEPKIDLCIIKMYICCSIVVFWFVQTRAHHRVILQQMFNDVEPSLWKLIVWPFFNTLECTHTRIHAYTHTHIHTCTHNIHTNSHMLHMKAYVLQQNMSLIGYYKYVFKLSGFI